MEHAALISKEAQRCPYNPGNLTRTLTRVGLIVSVLFGIDCIVFGALIRSHALPVGAEMYSGGNLLLSLDPPFIRELLLLSLNLTFIKISVWSSGTVHEMALKWKLAFEDDRQTEHMRLEFNANLRFLQSSYEWWSANRLPANVIMALCLAISYASSSMVLMSVERSDGAYNVIVPFVALYVLGVTTLLQSSVAFYAISTTKIPTWSQSPFDTAAVLVNEDRLKRRPGRCMHALFDRFQHGPVKPRKRQESAWASHPQFRRFVMYIWMLVAAGYYWAFIIWGMMDSGTQGSHRGSSWNPIPWTASNNSISKQSRGKDTGAMNFGWEGIAPTVGLLWGLGILVGFQGGIITTAMTCAQTLVALVYDERLWREASTKRGSDPSPGFFKRIFISWQTMTIHIADPILHWLFGLAVSLDASVGFQIHPVQILYVTITGTFGVILITAAGKFRPHVTQPSTYGHLQTLVDLIDNWYDKMYWGHKYDGHAGTSDHLLDPIGAVHMKSLYGFKDLKDC